MKAAVLFYPGGRLEVVDVELPRLAEDEVLVRLAFSGVCRSDYHVAAGEWNADLPLILGHEGAGVVEAVGSQVRGLESGDSVILSWTPYCRRCYFCVRGEPYLCETYSSGELLAGRGQFTLNGESVARFAAVGSFAELAIVHESAAVKVRGDMPLDKAALIGCAVPTGIGAVLNTAEVRPGATVLVIGCGGVGLSIVQGAHLVSASMVIAVDVNQSKLELARELGATNVLDPARVSVHEEVMALTSGRGIDVAFEAIGISSMIELAIDVVRPGGKAIVVGQPADGDLARIDAHRLSDRGKSLIGCNYGSARPSIDFPLIVDMYLSGRLQLDRFVSQTRPLGEVNEAFEALAKGEVARTLLTLDPR